MFPLFAWIPLLRFTKYNNILGVFVLELNSWQQVCSTQLFWRYQWQQVLDSVRIPFFGQLLPYQYGQYILSRFIHIMRFLSFACSRFASFDYRKHVFLISYVAGFSNPAHFSWINFPGQPLNLPYTCQCCLKNVTGDTFTTHKPVRCISFRVPILTPRYHIHQ